MTGPATVVLVGCGKMGGALLEGWLARSAGRPDIHVIEAHGPTADRLRAGPAGATEGVRVYDRPEQIDPGLSPRAVVFALKPQTLDTVAGAYRRFVGPDTVFLSIAAGKRIQFFANHLGPDAAIVRAMPNTPAAIGRGISVACANGRATSAQKARCQALLEAVGDAAWVEDEALLDPVTAVSGSGPAYVFLMIDCLAAAGVAAGLGPDLSARLALATVSGAGELARRADDPPRVLRRNVTSPGGTTEAALGVLMAEDGLQPLLERAVAAASSRARELGA